MPARLTIATRRSRLALWQAEHVKALWDVTPWMRELDLLSNIAGSGVFDRLKGPIRDAAFHLLWHAKEITLDREPITQDKLKV